MGRKSLNKKMLLLLLMLKMLFLFLLMLLMMLLLFYAVEADVFSHFVAYIACNVIKDLF